MPEFVLPAGKGRANALDLARTILASLDELVPWKVTAEPVKDARSLSQNAYLWAVPYRLLAEHTGYEADELHEYFCGQYFGWREKKVPKKPPDFSGVEHVPIRTTTTGPTGKRDVLTPHEFSEFVAFIQRFAAEKCGVLVPDPDPLYQLKREREQ